VAIYIYRTATGVLYSYNPNDVDPVANAATLTANGLTALTGQLPLDATHQWDAPTHSVVVTAAPATVRSLSTYAFLLRFTGLELQAIYTTADTTALRPLRAIQCAITVDLNDTTLNNWLAYLVTIGLLGPGRPAAITA
jgi:hypothetical protein